MLKVTKLNVTRFSEDGLYLALDSLKASDEMHPIIEAELDRRIEMEQEALRRRHNAQLESMKLTQAIQAELQEIFAGFKGKKTLMLIENFGQEFIEDYIVDEVSCTVYSKVTHEVFNNPASWEFDTVEQARCKLAKLVYYRVYDKFMRNATTENLLVLKRVLGE
jgi:hypothetical protein